MEQKTLEDKYEAILEVEKGQKSKAEVARIFNVPKNTLSGWLKKAESIKKVMQSSGGKEDLRALAVSMSLKMQC